MAKRPSVALVSLGCPKNLVDSEVILARLEEAGYSVVEETKSAQVIIVNTCAFIDAAQEEAVEAILDLADLKSRGHCKALICAGCLSQRFGPDLFAEMPELDGIVGPHDLERIGDVIARALKGERPIEVRGTAAMEAAPARWRSGSPVSRYVKIADGCDHTCSFCTIPELRGPYRSRPSDAIAQECRQMVEGGTRELVLVAQDTTAYGTDLSAGEDLPRLLVSLRTLPFEGWIRLLYLHPDRLDERLIETIGEHMSVVNYFDMPLQHVEPRLLADMRRAGSPEAYLALVQQIRRIIPGAALRTTFLLGYPGETDRDFDLLLEFIQDARFDRATCFAFSAQEGTTAAERPDRVAPEVVAERVERFMATQEVISLAHNRQFEGQRLRVLVEEREAETGLWVGRTYRDAPEVDGQVLLEAGPGTKVGEGDFVWASIDEALVHDLRGRIA
jgi:ribosomal protein S12 methylthiotransferase